MFYLWQGNQTLERRFTVKVSNQLITTRRKNTTLADVVLGSPEFNFSSTLVNSQLVCLPPVGILNHVMFIYHYSFTLVLKSPDGEWPITYIIIIIIIKSGYNDP